MIPKFVEIENELATLYGHEMGHIFESNYQYISFCKKCNAPLYFTYDHNNNRSIRGLATSTTCRSI